MIEYASMKKKAKNPLRTTQTRRVGMWLARKCECYWREMVTIHGICRKLLFDKSLDLFLIPYQHGTAIRTRRECLGGYVV